MKTVQLFVTTCALLIAGLAQSQQLRSMKQLESVFTERGFSVAVDRVREQQLTTVAANNTKNQVGNRQVRTDTGRWTFRRPNNGRVESAEVLAIRFPSQEDALCYMRGQAALSQLNTEWGYYEGTASGHKIGDRSWHIETGNRPTLIVLQGSLLLKLQLMPSIVRDSHTADVALVEALARELLAKARSLGI